MATTEEEDARIQEAVEQACAQFHASESARPQAERVLLEFRQRAPVSACRRTLERSRVLEARFHAACALREAVLREWAALPPGEAAGARIYALDCALALAPATGPEAAVRSTLLGAVAVLLKRGWCDDGAARAGPGGEQQQQHQHQHQHQRHQQRQQHLMQEHAAFLGELERRSAQAAQGPAGPAAIRVGLEALEAVVAEFSLVGGGGNGGGGNGGSNGGERGGGGGGGGGGSSSLGMARERHARCRDELERHFLPSFFTHARRIAREACASGAALRGEDGGSCRAAMRLMTAVLSWDRFSHPSQPHHQQHGNGAPAAANGGFPTNSCEPGADWAALLLDPATTDWLLSLLAALRGMQKQQRQQHQQQHQQHQQPQASSAAAAARQAEETQAAARQLLVALAALGGPGLFPKPAPGAPACSPQALAHLTAVLRGVLPLVHPADAALEAAMAAGGSEDELLDACRALSALCANHRAAALAAASDELARSAPGAPGLFSALEALLRAALEAGGVSPASATEAWLPDVVEMALESLGGALLMPSAGCSGPPPAAAVETAWRAFVALADAALADAAAGAHEDEDADEEHGAGAALQEEWFARVAALARADPAASFAHLADVVERLRAALLSAAASGQDPSELLEQLVWALRMAAHALADSGAGESPAPPEPVLRAVLAGGDGGRAATAAVLRLSRALLGVAALPLQEAARPVCSARLVETAVAASARWADTYLGGGGGGADDDDDDNVCPPLPPALEAAFGLGGAGGSNGNGNDNGNGNGAAAHGGGGGGAEVLDALSHLAVTCLAGGYSGEAALHMAVCRVLLPSLVRRRRACAVLVGRPLDGWRQLCAAFASRDALLAVQLPQKAQRFLAQALCEAAAGLPTGEQQHSYVTQLIGPAAAELAALAAAPAAQLAAPAASLRACCLLETLRGAALGTLPSTQRAVYAQLSTLLPSLLALHDAFKRRPDVVALLLKLADALVETQADALGATQAGGGAAPGGAGAGARPLLEWALALLRQYQASQLWQSSLRQAAAALREEQMHEQCRDLRAVLSLLTHVTQRGRGGVNGGAGGEPDDGGLAPQVALAGLHIVLPLISSELLRFPKLAGLYYGLLCDLLNAHAATVASLPAPHFASLMASLEWGLGGGGGGGGRGGSPAGPAAAAAVGGGGNNDPRVGINNPLAVRYCLEALAGLARFAAGTGPPAAAASAAPAAASAAARAAAAAALAPHAPQPPDTSVVGHFQRVLLTRLLLEDAPQDTVELAADALLPLLVAEPDAFAQLRDGIVAAAAAAVVGAGGGAAAAAVVVDEGPRRAAVTAVAKAMDELLAWLQQDQRRRQLELEQERRDVAAGMLPGAGPAGGAGTAGGGAAAAARMRQVAAGRVAQREFRQLLCSTVANVRGLMG